MRVDVYAYYVNKLHQNVGLETWIRHQIVTSQTAHTKYKWPPYATEWSPPMKLFAYATGGVKGGLSQGGKLSWRGPLAKTQKKVKNESESLDVVDVYTS